MRADGEAGKWLLMLMSCIRAGIKKSSCSKRESRLDVSLVRMIYYCEGRNDCDEVNVWWSGESLKTKCDVESRMAILDEEAHVTEHEVVVSMIDQRKLYLVICARDGMQLALISSQVSYQ